MNEWIIITGHTAGIGQAMTKQFLDRGFAVLGIARRPSTKNHLNLKQLSVDLADPLAVEACFTHALFLSVLTMANKLILINNAGTVVPNAVAGRQSNAEIIQAVSLNVLTPMLFTNEIIAKAKKATDIRIAHISSGAARKSFPAWSVYGGTKAALDRHADVVKQEQHPHIRIASIAPGIVDTQMQATIRVSDARDFPIKSQFEKLKYDHFLQTPEQTATKIISLIQKQNYGDKICLDLREDT